MVDALVDEGARRLPGARARQLAAVAFGPLRRMMLAQVLGAHDLMVLLMKPRNGQRWDAEDRRRLRAGLAALGRATPLFAIFWLPGGAFLLAPLAWFLDRRFRAKHPEAGAAPAPPGASG